MSRKMIGDIMREAQKLQSEMQKMQEEAKKKTVEATAGGGMVTVVANGGNQIVSITVDKEVVNPEDVEMLQDLIMAATNEALRRAQEMVNEEMSKLTGGLQLPGLCSRCFNITESELCSICRDATRDSKKICVVEEPSNIHVIEGSGSFHGLYHVLLGALAPIDGMTPEKLKIAELLERVKENGTEEVIIATNPNTRGETTAQYLREVLLPLNVNVTRIAYGLPMGGDIEFADEVTLKKALEGRRKI
jgi:recombination protein RecR